MRRRAAGRRHRAIRGVRRARPKATRRQWKNPSSRKNPRLFPQPNRLTLNEESSIPATSPAERLSVERLFNFGFRIAECGLENKFGLVNRLCFQSEIRNPKSTIGCGALVAVWYI